MTQLFFVQKIIAWLLRVTFISYLYRHIVRLGNYAIIVHIMIPVIGVLFFDWRHILLFFWLEAIITSSISTIYRSLYYFEAEYVSPVRRMLVIIEHLIAVYFIGALTGVFVYGALVLFNSTIGVNQAVDVESEALGVEVIGEENYGFGNGNEALGGISSSVIVYSVLITTVVLINLLYNHSATKHTLIKAKDDLNFVMQPLGVVFGKLQIVIMSLIGIYLIFNLKQNEADQTILQMLNITDSRQIALAMEVLAVVVINSIDIYANAGKKGKRAKKIK